MVARPPGGVVRTMIESSADHVPTEPAAGRATPLPEEQAAQLPGENRADHRAEAEAILAESEERVRAVVDQDPDAADEHRRSEETL